MAKKLTIKQRNAIAAEALAMYLVDKIQDSERPTVDEAKQWIEGILPTRWNGRMFRSTKPKQAGAEALWTAWQFESGTHQTITGLMMLSGEARELRIKASNLAEAMWDHRKSLAAAANKAISE
jgi:hypothetical protein